MSAVGIHFNCGVKYYKWYHRFGLNKCTCTGAKCEFNLLKTKNKNKKNSRKHFRILQLSIHIQLKMAQ